MVCETTSGWVVAVLVEEHNHNHNHFIRPSICTAFGQLCGSGSDCHSRWLLLGNLVERGRNRGCLTKYG